MSLFLVIFSYNENNIKPRAEDRPRIFRAAENIERSALHLSFFQRCGSLKRILNLDLLLHPYKHKIYNSSTLCFPEDENDQYRKIGLLRALPTTPSCFHQCIYPLNLRIKQPFFKHLWKRPSRVFFRGRLYLTKSFPMSPFAPPLSKKEIIPKKKIVESTYLQIPISKISCSIKINLVQDRF